MQWQNILWLFLVIGAPAISWTVTKLREQYERKRLRDMQRVREEESIRVQRIADRTERIDPEEEKAQRLAELAARRQAQLEQLRQRRGQGEAPTPVVFAPPTTAPRPGAPARPGTPRPGIPGPVTGGQRPVRRPPPPAQAPRPRPVVRPVPQMQAPPTQPVRAAMPAPQGATRPVESTSLTGESDSNVVHRSAPTVGSDVRSVLRGGGTEASRRIATAFAISEVLGKPVGIRSQTSGGMHEF